MTYHEIVGYLAPLFKAGKPRQIVVCLVFQPEDAEAEVICVSNAHDGKATKELLRMFLDEGEVIKEIHGGVGRDS